VWVLVVAPLLSIGLSNADVVILAWNAPLSEAAQTWFAVATTLPLSMITCGITLWLLLRLRREAILRSEAEQDTREALTDLERVLERERLLHRELDHRVRNNLASLLGLVAIYEASDASRDDVVAALRGKILTLREAYALLAASQGEGVALADLLNTIATAVIGHPAVNRLHLQGPGVRLIGREANAIAMITQELLTNATKHGALSWSGGDISAAWVTHDTPTGVRVNLTWRETLNNSSPKHASPRTNIGGMGLMLIESFAASDLRGKVSFRQDDALWIVELTANLTTATRGVERPETEYGPPPVLEVST